MSKLVLVIDDEQDICRFIEIALRQHGYEVQSAYDGLAGKAAIEKLHPDLVVLDLKMPKLNGYELVLWLKQNEKYKNLPVIIITSVTEDSRKPDDQWRDSLEVSDFITKPFETEELVTRVTAILEPAQR